MRNLAFYRKSVLLTIFLSAVPTTKAVVPANDLMIQGTSYPNACTKQEQRALKTSLLKVNPPDANQAWRAIYTLLCAPIDRTSQRRIEKILMPLVKSRSEGTGEEADERSLAGNSALAQELLAGGQAWNASITTSDAEITVHYASNEACMDSVTFEYRNRMWRITSLAGACD